MSDQQFTELWEDALVRFQETTGKNLKDESITKPASVDDLIQAIEVRHNKFSAYREQGATLRKCVRAALAPVKMLGDLAAGGASTVFPPSQLIFGGVLFLMSTAENVGAAYNAISVLFIKLEDFTSRLRVHAEQDISEGLRNIFIQILTTLLEILALSAKRIHHGSRVKEYLECALFGGDSKIDSAVALLERLTKSELMMTAAETLCQVNRSAKVINRVEESDKEIRDALKQIQDDSTIQKIKNALKPQLGTLEIYEKAKAEILRDSGQWIRDDTAFSDWMDRKTPLLWVYGFPGAGKSFLSCSIVQRLEQLHPQGVQDAALTSVAYFFCKTDDPKLRSLDSVLRTIAYQITKNDPIYAKHVAGMIDFVEDCRSLSNLWSRLILDFFSRKDGRSSVFVVIDALDEMEDEDRTSFFGLLKSFRHADDGLRRQNVHVLLLGRPNITEELEDVLGTLPPMIEVNPSKNSADIKRYIEDTVARSPKLQRRPKALREEIVEKLSAGANGFFLWATLMLKEVQSKDRPDQIRKTLNNLPKGLTNTLRRVVARFSETLDRDQIDDLNHMLSWVVCAQRPLYLQELSDSLRFRSSGELEVYDLDRLVRYRYASFFTATNYRGGALHDQTKKPDQENDKPDDKVEETGANQSEDESLMNSPKFMVTVAHASIAEFLKGSEQDQGSGVRVDVVKTKIEMAKTCLRVFCDAKTFEACDTPSGLACYATYAFEHLPMVDLPSVDIEQKREIAELLVQFFRDEATIARWVKRDRHAILPDLLESEDFVSVVCRWYNDSDVRSFYIEDSATLGWLDLVTSAPLRNLLRPVALECARRWLQDDSNYSYEVEFLCAYTDKLRNLKAAATEISGQEPEPSSATALIELARWAGFEETAMWQSRVAWTLLGYDHPEEAIKFCQKAIDGGLKDAQTLRCLSLAYSTNRDEDKALETAKLSVAVASGEDVERTMAQLLFCELRTGRLDESIATFHQYLDEVDRSDEVSREVYFFINGLLDSNYSRKNEEVLETIKRMVDVQRSVEFFYRLAEDISLNRRLLEVAIQNNSVGLLRKLYERGEEILSADDLVENYKAAISAIRAHLALLLLRATEENERAIDLLQEVLSNPEMDSSDFKSLRDLVEEQLLQAYLCGLLEAKSLGNTNRAREYATRLSTYAKRNKLSPGGNDLSLIIAAWHRAEGNLDQAKEFLRPGISLGIDMLIDDTDENDDEAWYRLVRTLSVSGDVVNASAVLSHSKQMNMPVDVNDGNRHELDQSHVSCNGCSGDIGRRQAQYSCCYCVDTDLCGTCYELLKDDKLPLRICGKAHEFTYVPPVEAGYPKGEIKVDGKFMKITDWLGDLTEKYLHPSSGGGERTKSPTAGDSEQTCLLLN